MNDGRSGLNAATFGVFNLRTSGGEFYDASARNLADGLVFKPNAS